MKFHLHNFDATFQKEYDTYLYSFIYCFVRVPHECMVATIQAGNFYLRKEYENVQLAITTNNTVISSLNSFNYQV